jgi:hypothetical protein
MVSGGLYSITFFFIIGIVDFSRYVSGIPADRAMIRNILHTNTKEEFF